MSGPLSRVLFRLFAAAFLLVNVLSVPQDTDTPLDTLTTISTSQRGHEATASFSEPPQSLAFTTVTVSNPATPSAKSAVSKVIDYRFVKRSNASKRANPTAHPNALPVRGGAKKRVTPRDDARDDPISDFASDLLESFYDGGDDYEGSSGENRKRRRRPHYITTTGPSTATVKRRTTTTTPEPTIPSYDEPNVSFENKLPDDGKEPQRHPHNDIYNDDDDDEDEDESSASDDEDYEDDDDSEENAILASYDEDASQFLRPQSSYNKRRPQYTFYNDDDDDDEDDDDDDDDDDYYNAVDALDKNEHNDREPPGASITAFIMDLFYQIFARFTGLPASTDYEDDDGGEEDDYYYDENNYAARRTTPRSQQRRPSYSQYLGFVQQGKQKSSGEKVTPKARTEWFGSWFGASAEEETTTLPTLTTVTEPMAKSTGAWDTLVNFFGGSEPTTTRAPSPLNTVPNLDAVNTSFSAAVVANLIATALAAKPTAGHNLPATGQPAIQTAAATVTATSDGIPLTGEQRKSYAGYQLWRLRPSNSEQVASLTAIRSVQLEYVWWKGPTLDGRTDVLVPARRLVDFRRFLSDEGIKFSVTVRDVEMAIQYANPHVTDLEAFELESAQGHPMTWHRYHRYKDHVKFMEYLQRRYPNNIELIHIGRSFEGRPIVVVHIFQKRPRRDDHLLLQRDKQAIFVEAGMQGHEWIGPAVAAWILKDIAESRFQLVNLTLDRPMLAREWYILPVANPDGYEYAHTNDRLWNKNRAFRKALTSVGFFTNFFSLKWFNNQDTVPDSGGSGNENSDADRTREEQCMGINLNRNFGYQFAKDDKVNTHNRCSPDYSGAKAFSEPETRALSKFLKRIERKVKLYISLRAYGQFVGIPKVRQRRLRLELVDMADNAVTSLRKFGNRLDKYYVDERSRLQYSQAGSSTSFVLNEMDIRRAFEIHLRDTGAHGFLLPASYIETTAREAYELIKLMIDDLPKAKQ